MDQSRKAALKRLIAAIAFWPLSACGADSLFDIRAWQTWKTPDRQSWTVTANFLDSDEDAAYTLERGWHKRWNDSRWEIGWTIGLGIADSGKYERTGGLATLDLVFGREIWTADWATLAAFGAAGLQAHTITYPGGSYYNGRLATGLELRPGRKDPSGPTFRLGYLHISNANLGPGNEGLDAIWLGTGWSW